MCVYLFATHVAAVAGLQRIGSWWVLTETIFWTQVTGMGITLGAHRLWSHRSYKARTPTRVVLMLLASMANQGDLFHWCRDHRVHHNCSDSRGDPHDIKRGFFYAHIGWLMLKKNDVVKSTGNSINCDDLLADPVIAFHRAVNPLWNQLWAFGVPGVYGVWRLGSVADGLLIFGALRWVIVSHGTWCVNSVAHMYGTRPYKKTIAPVESFLTAIVASGEGWHNYHHTYPWDYATAEHNWWWQWNPSKVAIDALSLVGQTYDCKRATVHK
jgi:stearoyl-CoA desaturase (delta-9 desaturase)